ncbi:hypothetical protein D9M71_824270 [compost metagenome]
MGPDIACHRSDAQLQPGVIHRLLSPHRALVQCLFFVLRDREQALLEFGKEVPALWLGDELAEELAIGHL